LRSPSGRNGNADASVRNERRTSSLFAKERNEIASVNLPLPEHACAMQTISTFDRTASEK